MLRVPMTFVLIVFTGLNLYAPGRGAREVVHLIALEQDRLDDVVADDLEVGLADVVLDVLLRAREEIVEAHA